MKTTSKGMAIKWIRRYAWLAVASLVTMEATAGTDDEFWLPRWSFRRSVTVRSEMVDGDLTNFPVLVRLNGDNFDFREADPQGRDVRFALPDGTLLAYERERHDVQSREGLYWVRLPLVAADEDTVFHLYYGRAGAPDGTNSHQVWTSNYIGVWHLNDVHGGTYYDASSNQLHGVAGNEPLDGEGVPGMIGGSVRLVVGRDAEDNKTYTQYIVTDPMTIDTAEGLTFSIWAQPGDIVQNSGSWVEVPVMYLGGANWAPYYVAKLCYYGYSPTVHNERIRAHCNVWSGEGGKTLGSDRGTGFTTGVWHHAAATFYYYEGATNTNTTVKLYLDGIKIIENSVEGYALRNPLGPRPLGLGAETHHSYPANEPRTTFDGMLDEARVANIVRGDAWIRASYLNQKSNDELLRYGELERQPTGLYLLLR